MPLASSKPPAISSEPDSASCLPPARLLRRVAISAKRSSVALVSPPGIRTVAANATNEATKMPTATITRMELMSDYQMV